MDNNNLPDGRPVRVSVCAEPSHGCVVIVQAVERYKNNLSRGSSDAHSTVIIYNIEIRNNNND